MKLYRGTQRRDVRGQQETTSWTPALGVAVVYSAKPGFSGASFQADSTVEEDGGDAMVDTPEWQAATEEERGTMNEVYWDAFARVATAKYPAVARRALKAKLLR